MSRVSLRKLRFDGVNKQEENRKQMNSSAVRNVTNCSNVCCDATTSQNTPENSTVCSFLSPQRCCVSAGTAGAADRHTGCQIGGVSSSPNTKLGLTLGGVAGRKEYFRIEACRLRASAGRVNGWICCTYRCTSQCEREKYV